MSPSIGSPAWIIAVHRLAVGREQVFLTSLPPAASLHPAGCGNRRAEIRTVPHDPKTSASIPRWSTVKRLPDSPSCPKSRHGPALPTCGCFHSCKTELSPSLGLHPAPPPPQNELMDSASRPSCKISQKEKPFLAELIKGGDENAGWRQ